MEKFCWLCRRNRRGAAAVEFALVAPLFFLMIMGMIEFGRLIMVQQIITNASREGARLAVLDDPRPGPEVTADVVATVENYLAGGSISGATITVTPDPPNGAGYGEPVTVTVTVPFSQVSWLPETFFGDRTGKNLSAQTVMRRETVQ